MIFTTVPFVSSPHSLMEKWAFLPLTDTHRHGGYGGCLCDRTLMTEKAQHQSSPVGDHKPLEVVGGGRMWQWDNCHILTDFPEVELTGMKMW